MLFIFANWDIIIIGIDVFIKIHLSIEKSITQLNKDGLPVINSDIDDEIDICLTCKRCGETYDVEKKGMYFRVKRELPIINNPSLEDFNPFSI